MKNMSPEGCARNNFGPDYWDMSKRYYREHSKLTNYLHNINYWSLNPEDISDEDYRKEVEASEAGYLCVILSAMYLEFTVYDFSARHLSDRYVVEHLDKLDIISKWLVSTRIITGKEIDKSKLASFSFNVIHAKSEKNAYEFTQAVEASQLAIKHLSIELKAIYNGGWFPFWGV